MKRDPNRVFIRKIQRSTTWYTWCSCCLWWQTHTTYKAALTVALVHCREPHVGKTL